MMRWENSMFTDDEKELLIWQEFDGAEQGSYLFLLDSSEVEKYMPESDDELYKLRFCEATDWAITEGDGGGVEVYKASAYTGPTCNWDLRNNKYVGGQHGNLGDIVGPYNSKLDYHHGIRPAVWITLP